MSNHGAGFQTRPCLLQHILQDDVSIDQALSMTSAFGMQQCRHASLAFVQRTFHLHTKTSIPYFQLTYLKSLSMNLMPTNPMNMCIATSYLRYKHMLKEWPHHLNLTGYDTIENFLETCIPVEDLSCSGVCEGGSTPSLAFR